MENKRAKAKTTLRNWDTLDRHLLLKIFEKVDTESLCSGAFWVSRAWQSACCQKVFFKGHILDFSDVLDLFRPVVYDENGKWPGHGRLMSAQKTIIDYLGVRDETNDSGNISVDTVILPPAYDLQDAHLVYVAERLPSLKKVVIPFCLMLTGKGFSRAIRNWKELTELSIGPLMRKTYLVHIFQEIGINCKKLEKLAIVGSNNDTPGTGLAFELNEYTWSLLVEHLRSLKFLVLKDSWLSTLAIDILFKKHKKLQKVEIINCSKAVNHIPEENTTFEKDASGIFTRNAAN